MKTDGISERKWSTCYNKLREFRDKEGSLRLKPSMPDFVLLARWILEQRTSHDALTQEQIEKLLALGLDFGRAANQWYSHFFQLRKHYAEHNGLSASGSEMGVWMRKQRAARRKGALTPRQIEWLDSVGMEWG